MSIHEGKRKGRFKMGEHRVEKESETGWVRVSGPRMVIGAVHATRAADGVYERERSRM